MTGCLDNKMKDIKLPQKIEISKTQNNTATLVIEPCFPGYGLTLGNALRRVLLSSLGGGAVTAVKIKGVDHEFSSVPHVKEDVVEIILNLKKLRFKLHADDPVKVTLKAKGEKKVTAKEIKTTSDVETANPDQHIATLTNKKADLDMELTVVAGRGFNPVEQREGEKREIGEIAIDTVFTPIKKVNYNIENIRVGEMTNFDKLNITIETDGTMTPKDAFEEAAAILVDHFTLLSGLKRAEKSKPAKRKVRRKRKKAQGKKDQEEESVPIEDFLLEDLKLSTRTVNALKKKRIRRVKQLVKMTGEKLTSIPGIGPAAVKEIKRVLGRKGILLEQS